MKIKTVPSTWIENEGHRLDCGPYMSGAIETRELLQKLKVPKDRLQDLTQEGINGIINPGRITRNWVNNPEYGYPFLSSTDILQADLSYVSYIAKSVAKINSKLLIKENWTLITRSGTIGRMAYARSDMHGMACTEDVLRVIPDQNKILPGYLYAYLSTRFGVPLVISGTYGSIITHLEPNHIADLPVPRLGEVEQQTHELIQQAADLHVEALALRKQAADLLNSICNFPEKLAFGARNFAFSSASSADVLKRLDATYHNPVAQEAEKLVENAKGITLAEADIKGFESNRLKQVFVDPGYGTPFITSGGIFNKTITPERYLKNQLLGEDESWRINENDTLIARSGQVGGIIGRGVWADKRFDGFAASPHILRIRSQNLSFPPGYVYTFLCLTDVGYQLLARTAAGSSIPFLPLDSVLSIKIPQTPSIQQRNQIDQLIKESGNLLLKSQELEATAVSLVERTIEEGGQ
ncbi:hypothetical protein ACFO25_16770 [Paenactinomyces guangxiensis]|uniref:Restriction endonuclease subunit S n=1 Tax=Paenactinomyces guangxiensis TaxID=1490290 RepID=A0A7W2AAX3_9BACL|nr:restriction endonuclease subunit S [Paenactinomyces guangxiensis]MBA4496308.1 restriction endonuclease subunit S [Paenactinomyces guangxiensis]MBH8593454.1 hypothetical protein [Paenactinomyces guangxiensis]